MALTLIATPGASNANTYCTQNEAVAYFETRLFKEDWTDAGTRDKNAALVWATRVIDEQAMWYGYKQTNAQALRWPRSNVYDTDGYPIVSSEIPQWLKNATAEFAMHLIAEDRTLETNRDLKGFEEMQIGSLKMKIDAYTFKPLVPNSVWSIINPYCEKTGKSKTLERM